jgi:NAD-dependent deacetylase
LRWFRSFNITSSRTIARKKITFEIKNEIEMKRIVVLSGAGISAESGIPTFRGSDGLWEGHSIEEVATPQAWQEDFRKVLHFYNMRRKAAESAKPNLGHTILVELEAHFDVQIITQNVDSLHERAGSSDVLHLHGELSKVRSTKNESLVYETTHWEVKEGDLCELGSQLRPHIVWFGEAVPMLEPAIDLVATADVLIVVGTSLQVYPAASLVNYAQVGVPVYVVDPNLPDFPWDGRFHAILKGGSEGLAELKELLLKQL